MLGIDSDAQIVPRSTGIRLSNDVGDEIGTRDYRSIAVHLPTRGGERTWCTSGQSYGGSHARTRKDRFDACRLLVSDCDVILKLSPLAPPTCNCKKNNQAKRNASRGRSIHQCKSRKPPASAGAVHHRSEGNDFRYASTASVLRRPRLLG